MSQPSYEQLLEQHTGKLVDKWTLYLRLYEEVLGPRRALSGNVLEIGVQNGGSLELLSEYLPDAKRIIGCDIDENCRQLTFADPRLEMVVGDANDKAVVDHILSVAPDFDVIIDDGSHDSRDIIESLMIYYPRLNDGGVYIIEDLHCSYWRDYHGGVAFEHSSMAFLKAIADVINSEHWSFDASVEELLQPTLDFYGIEGDLSCLAQVHAIEFRNSLAVLRKAPAAENVLGERRVRGSEALVMPEVKGVGGSDCKAPESSSALPDEQEPNRAVARLAQLKAQLAEASAGIENPESAQFVRDLSMELERALQYQKVMNSDVRKLRHENHQLRAALSR